MQSLKELLQGKYIICSCEGHAEQAIIDILLDAGYLCFHREDLVGKKCTQIRKGKNLASAFLNMEMEKEIIIIRILDRKKEKLALPNVYRYRNDIQIINIITQPEIEILHIIDGGVFHQYRHQRNLKKPSAYCKRYLTQNSKTVVKSRDYVLERYEGKLNRLIKAIKQYKQLFPKQKDYCLADLLR